MALAPFCSKFSGSGKGVQKKKKSFVAATIQRWGPEPKSGEEQSPTFSRIPRISMRQLASAL
jgi:hypothetical protein